MLTPFKSNTHKHALFGSNDITGLTLQKLYSLSYKTSHRKISQATRYWFRVVRSLWNLTSASARELCHPDSGRPSLHDRSKNHNRKLFAYFVRFRKSLLVRLDVGCYIILLKIRFYGGHSEIHFWGKNPHRVSLKDKLRRSHYAQTFYVLFQFLLLMYDKTKKR